MWTVIYIAANKVEAELAKEFLTAEGFCVTIRPAGVPHMGDARPHEILVPKGEAEEAQRLLISCFNALG